VAQPGGGVGEVVLHAAQRLVRPPLQVGADQPGHEFQAGADHVAQGQRPAGPGRHPLRHPDRVIQVVQHVAEQAGEHPAGVGELNRAGGPDEQGDLELALQLLDGLADPRRGHQETLGGAGEAKFFRDGEERP
jgi:hypothetical protein